MPDTGATTCIPADRYPYRKLLRNSALPTCLTTICGWSYADRHIAHTEWRRSLFLVPTEWVAPDIDYVAACPDLPVAPD